MPLVHAKGLVEAVCDGVPRHQPTHPRLHALDVRLRRRRSESQRSVAGVQMREVCNLVGHEGTAAASMFGPAKHARLEERAVDDQLTPAFEQIEQAHSAARPVELVLLRHCQPRHSAALGGERVTGAGQSLFFHEKLLTRSLPLFRRYDRGRLHYDTLSHVVVVVLLHILSLFSVVLADVDDTVDSAHCLLFFESSCAVCGSRRRRRKARTFTATKPSTPAPEVAPATTSAAF